MATINGTSGNDTLNGTLVSDTINGLAGNDTINGGGGADVLVGGTGDDILSGGTGTDTFKFAAGDGQDTIKDLSAGETVQISGYSAAQSITQVGTSVVVVLSSGDRITFQNTTVAVVQAALVFHGGGTSGDDTLDGTSGDDTLDGLGGNDTINGFAGHDTLAGGSGADVIDGGDGDDRLFSGDISPPWSHPYYGNSYTPPLLDTGTEVDTLTGGAGWDIIFAGYGDHVDGGEGIDYLYISFLGAPSGVTVDFRQETQVIGGGTITGIENISWVQGSNFDDYINVGSHADGNGYSDFTIVFGMGGNDHLVAGYYTGVLDGGDGNDTVDGRGSQYLQAVYGGAGDDILYTDTNTFAVAYGGDGNDTIYSHGETYGGEGNDTIILSVSYYGGPVHGDAGDDAITGTSNGDLLYGDGGNDTIHGHAGDDLIDGGAGTDILTGGTGNDTLSGGADDDLFRFGQGDGSDVITDFASGDIVDIDGYDSAQSITQVGSDVVVVFSATDQITFQNIDVATVHAGLVFEVPTDDNLTGGTGDDYLHGFGGNDTIHGLGGYDTLVGGSGADLIDGGADDDILYSADVSPPYSFPYYGSPYTPPVLDTGSEVDTLIGGDGNDIIFAGYGDNVDGGANGAYGDKLFISFQGATSGVTFDGTLATQVIAGGTITGIENVSWIQGSEYDDHLTVGSGNGYSDRTTVMGMGGNDTLIAGYYTAVLDGGDGNDIVDGRISQYLQEVNGGDGDDILYTSTNTFAVANGGSGNDTIYAHGEIHGGDGDDTIYVVTSYYPGPVNGDAGNDTILGSDNGDDIHGGAGLDTLDGAAGNDTLTGGSGNDIFKFKSGGGQDVITDLASGDTVEIRGYTAAQSITQDGTSVVLILSSGDRITFQNTTVAAVQAALVFSDGGGATITGTHGDDILNGTEGDDTIDGGFDGRDTIYGNGGNDTIYGGIGDDRLYGGEGDDVIYAGDSGSFTYPDWIWDGPGNDIVYGEAGEDLIFGSPGNDYYDGGSAYGAGPDFDRVTYGGASAGIVVDMRLSVEQVRSSGSGDAANIGVDTLVDIEGVHGSAFDDVMTAGASSQTFWGGGGNDILTGGAGDDWLYGDDGNDTISGGGGNDRLWGGAGDDTIDGGAGGDLVSYESAATGVTVSLAVSGPQSTGQGLDTLTNIEHLEGSSFDDSLTGNSASNTIDGGNGNDTIRGGAGDDSLWGGDGDDVFEFYAGDGKDVIGDHWPGEVVKIFGYASAQSITQSGDHVVVVLSSGDQITFRYTEVRYVEAALQFFDAPPPPAGPTEGDDILEGTSGDDVIDALGGNDTVSGLGGNDVLTGGPGNDLLDGGEGVDTASYSGAPAGVTVSLTLSRAQNTIGAGTDTLVSIENVTGSAFADRLTGNSAANVLTGLGGDDVLKGNGGDDTLVGGEGADRLVGGPGSDTLEGGAGNDVLDGGFHADAMAGGAGDDRYYVDNAADSVVELAGEGHDTVYSSIAFVLGANVENLVLTGTGSIYGTGNALDNVIIGNSGANKLYGLEGNDRLDGHEGNDTLDGGAGADVMLGGTGNDTYYVDDARDNAKENPGEGTDTVYASVSYTLRANVETLVLTGTAGLTGKGNELDNAIFGNSGANKLYGLDGNDRLDGGAGNDLLDGGTGADLMIGGTGDDIYYADDARDNTKEEAGEGTDLVYSSVSYSLRSNVENLTLTGTAAINGKGNELANVITGNSGANGLYGLAGNDTLNGGGGNDILEGGAGTDTMSGGAGADMFVFRDGDFGGLTPASADTILDFSQAEGDILRLDFVDANTALAGDQAFAFIGSGAFSGTAGELRYEISGGNTFVYGDTDGDGLADFMIQLTGAHTLTEGDFLI